MERKKKRLFLLAKMYILPTHPLHIFGVVREKKKKKEGMINPESTRKGKDANISPK